MLSRALALLEDRASGGRPLSMGLVGAGTFGTMLLAQVARMRGLEIAGVADLSPDRARAALVRASAPAERVLVTDDAAALVALDGLDVVVEATGSPSAGVEHALAAIDHGRHVVMVNVEADVLAGPALARRARAAGVVYSMAFGDQPALICELVDWARAAGFEVVCAGKGTKHLPGYHQATPDTVWAHYGLSADRVQAGGFNARMFTSFLDGTKSAVEMAAVCNATGLLPQEEGLRFPASGTRELARIAVPAADGGALSRSGTVEVVSSLQPDGRPIDDDLRWGVYVTLAAPSDYVAGCFADYGLAPDGGRYAAMYRPYHLIGLETTVSVLAAGLLGEPTGTPTGFRGDASAVAKRDLPAGEILDGEGGFTVYGALAPAARSVSEGALPIGLAHGARLARPVAAGAVVRVADVEDLAPSRARDLRKETEGLL